MSVKISVVVCTYNREDLIAGCLNSLINQTADSTNFEILIIDNNSTDKTCEIIKKYLCHKNFVLLHESKQGLSHARNRGIQEARGEYIAFLDDDARAHPDYVKNLEQILSQTEQHIDCLGGPILPFYTSPKPPWFKDTYEIRRSSPNPYFLKQGQSFSGSNMIWNRNLLLVLGGFNPDFGVKGKYLTLGEETALFDKLWNTREPRLLFSPDLIVYHWVPAHKMTIHYRLKRAFAVGQSLELISKDYKSYKRIINGLALFGISVKLAFRALFRIFEHAKIQNWLVEDITPIVTIIGKISVHMGYKPKMVQRVE